MSCLVFSSFLQTNFTISNVNPQFVLCASSMCTKSISGHMTDPHFFLFFFFFLQILKSSRFNYPWQQHQIPAEHSGIFVLQSSDIKHNSLCHIQALSSSVSRLNTMKRTLLLLNAATNASLWSNLLATSPPPAIWPIHRVNSCCFEGEPASQWDWFYGSLTRPHFQTSK